MRLTHPQSSGPGLRVRRWSTSDSPKMVVRWQAASAPWRLMKTACNSSASASRLSGVVESLCSRAEADRKSKTCIASVVSSSRVGQPERCTQSSALRRWVCSTSGVGVCSCMASFPFYGSSSTHHKRSIAQPSRFSVLPGQGRVVARWVSCGQIVAAVRPGRERSVRQPSSSALMAVGGWGRVSARRFPGATGTAVRKARSCRRMSHGAVGGVGRIAGPFLRDPS